MTLILKSNISPISYAFATQSVLDWAKAHSSRYVCVANVHMIMEAHDSPEFGQIINQADLVTPDGMPLVWLLRLKGQPEQERVYGPTLMLHILESAAQQNVSVGFYGSSPKVLQFLNANMHARFSDLKVDYLFSPPYRETDWQEDQEIVKQINASSVMILFVGLGCPKQEKWMAAHRGQIQAVMIGVGAAFDFHAGLKPQAPQWIQVAGMEWLYRLITEPRRLWKRYFYHNPRFIILALLDFLAYAIKRRE